MKQFQFGLEFHRKINCKNRNVLENVQITWLKSKLTGFSCWLDSVEFRFAFPCKRKREKKYSSDKIRVEFIVLLKCDCAFSFPAQSFFHTYTRWFFILFLLLLLLFVSFLVDLWRLLLVQNYLNDINISCGSTLCVCVCAWCTIFNIDLLVRKKKSGNHLK